MFTCTMKVNAICHAVSIKHDKNYIKSTAFKVICLWSSFENIYISGPNILLIGVSNHTGIIMSQHDCMFDKIRSVKTSTVRATV